MHKLKNICPVICIALFACNRGADRQQSAVAGGANVHDSGWVSLFNGRNLQGWHTYGDSVATPAWHAGSNTIHLDASKIDGDETIGGGDLITNDEFDNFDLRFEWKISKAGNSGVKIYVHEDTALYDEGGTGMEMQIVDNDAHEDGKTANHRAGSLYDMIAPNPETVKPAGEWNAAEIKCVNGQLQFYLNGTVIVSTTLWNDGWKKLIAKSKYKNMPGWGSFKKGHILLQDHGFDVWFRNMMVKRL